MPDPRVQYLIDRLDVSDTMTRFFQCMDMKNWDGVRACLFDDVAIYVTGAAMANPGLPMKPVPLEAFMASLIARNGGFLATLHMHPNQLVTIETNNAHVTSFQIAAHLAGTGEDESLWTYGLYEVDLVKASEGWRITSIAIDVRITNNVDSARIYEMAAERQRAQAKT